MKHASLLIILLLGLPFRAAGRVGETEAELTARFGKPVLRSQEYTDIPGKIIPFCPPSNPDMIQTQRANPMGFAMPAVGTISSESVNRKPVNSDISRHWFSEAVQA